MVAVSWSPPVLTVVGSVPKLRVMLSSSSSTSSSVTVTVKVFSVSPGAKTSSVGTPE